MHILNSINDLDMLDFLYIDIRHLMFPSFIYYFFFFYIEEIITYKFHWYICHISLNILLT